MHQRDLSLILALGLTAVSAFAACSATNEGNGQSSTSGDSSSSASGGAGGSGGDTSSSSSGGNFNPSQSGGSTGQGGEEGCLTTESEAEQKPLDMVLVIDRSSSMAGALWSGTVSALDAFLTDPSNIGVSAAINYFPPPQNPDECNPNSYNPTHVTMADLATNGATLSSNVSSQTPDGAYTPTHGALYGSLQFATQYQADNPDHVVVVVLASDGDPTSCNDVITDIADIAATAHAFNGVRTYAVAIQGATVANLDTIADAGGTGQAIDVTNDVTALSSALTAIRATLACEFDIPEPAGEPFDPTKLNIDYTPGDGSPSETIPQVDGPSECGSGDGWYYDNPNAPTKVVFCPDTCDRIKQDTGANVQFVFGCPTVIQ